jgi:NAD-dependent DNA ligase
VLSARLERIFTDGRVDPEEQAELAQLLQDLVGGKVSVAAGKNLSTTLPVDDPPPPIEFNGQVYVFTGMFAFGPRRECQRVVEELGARCESSITQRTTVLVIGTFASRDWKETSHGRKIMKAVDYRDRGVPLVIVGEDHWASQFP